MADAFLHSSGASKKGWWCIHTTADEKMHFSKALSSLLFDKVSSFACVTKNNLNPSMFASILLNLDFQLELGIVWTFYYYVQLSGKIIHGAFEPQTGSSTFSFWNKVLNLYTYTYVRCTGYIKTILTLKTAAKHNLCTRPPWAYFVTCKSI